MTNYGRLHPFQLILGFTLALVSALVMVAPIQAGDPDHVVGGFDLRDFECLQRGDNSDNDNDKHDGEFEDVVDIDQVRDEIISRSTGNATDDLKSLEGACDRLAEGEGRLVPIQKTKIEGYVYEFIPGGEDDGWIAIPAAGIPVVAEGIGFEIYWVSESNGYFYYYKTRFGSGPILLNMQLPPNATAINPNVLIESTGREDTWTIYLGFYRGNTPPPNIEDLRTPDDEPLPMSDSKFYNFTGIDGRSALPAVGGIKEEKESMPVAALAAIVAIILPVIGIITIRRSRQSNKTD
ncbi:MAG: hypothetical protein H6631_12090 [Anaerolineaceae bacterium]|nr:hypothetical protein [Anaerolineaceae bacterium]MCB9099857.1 hypothetical protein [Anaerolineales bacterium]